MLAFLIILLASQLGPAASVPRAYSTRPHSVTIVHPAAQQTRDHADKPLRKKKALISHHILVPNLHVIPIQHIHTDYNHIIQNAHGNVHGNSSHTLIPVFIHNFPIHDLTVIPLHRVDTNNFDNDDRARYRNPLGGYGAGWGFGGHGAGHGYHYAYG